MTKKTSIPIFWQLWSPEALTAAEKNPRPSGALELKVACLSSTEYLNKNLNVYLI